MDRCIGGVGELVGEHRAGGVGHDLRSLLDRSARALAAGGQDELGAIGPRQRPALHAHGLGHRQDHLVAAGRADHCQCDTGVAAGAFDDRAAGLQCAGGFRSVHDGHAESILDAGRGIVELELGQNRGTKSSADGVESDQRGVAKSFGDVLVNAAGHGQASFIVEREQDALQLTHSSRSGATCRSRRAQRCRGERLGRSCSAGGAQNGDDRLPEPLALALADTGDSDQLLARRRPRLGQCAQGRVGEDDVGGHPLLPRLL